MADDIPAGGQSVPGRATPTYICANCKGEFDYPPDNEWSDRDAREEAICNGFDPDAPDMVLVCDDCYQKNTAFAVYFGYGKPPGRPL